MNKISKERKIELLVELTQADIIAFRTNILGEIEVVPIGFDRETWKWYLEWGWNLKENELTELINLAFNEQTKFSR